MTLSTTIKSARPRPLPESIRVDIRDFSLVVESGPDAGLRIDQLGEHTLIGREPWCELSLRDVEVSGQHCEIVVEASGVRLRDLGSTNGTFCDGVRVVEAFVHAGSLMQVGGTCVRLASTGRTRSIECSTTDPTKRLIGASAPMQRLFSMMRRVAPREIPILLLGETGTGKTAVARAMHDVSLRADKPFVALNCGALPPELVETTLFGHVRGAYTGAHRSGIGIFEQAEGGSVLLDEIGEMPLALQPKLLSVLETRKVRPVGSEREIDVNFRLFAATNRHLPTDVARGKFRQDLYYRIAGIELQLPALRERRADIQHLARAFLDRAWREARARGEVCVVRDISDDALDLLANQPWLGNVRELEAVISRTMLFCENHCIQVDDLLLNAPVEDLEACSSLPGTLPPPALTPQSFPPVAGADVAAQPMPFTRATHPALPAVEQPEDGGGSLSFKDFKAELLARHEKTYLEELLRASGGNLTRAADTAGLSRTHLRAMLKRYGLLR